MFHKDPLINDPQTNYNLFIENIEGYITPTLPLVANLANFSALVAYFFDHVNWAGFYLMHQDRLVLGPFQGLPACTEIAIGKGVCGTSALLRKTVVVPKTADFPGHIVCDDASLSEIVVPIIKDGVLIGVLDVDSPLENRFGSLEQEYLERAVKILIDNIATL
jgi:L-methionine (R)-S-oxide reductase